MSALERRIIFDAPAFSKRDPDPAKDYGIGSAVMRFALVGPEGAISLGISTGWHLPHEAASLPAMALVPSGRGVCIHSPTKIEDYYGGPDECDLVAGGQCYGDVGYCAADELLAVLIADGVDALWERMERDWYRPTFIDRTGATP